MEQGLGSVHLYSYKEHGHDINRLSECINTADVVLLPRPHNEKWFEIIKTLRKHGKISVIDHDDDVFNLSPLNPYYKYIGIKEVKLPDSDEYLWYDGMMNFSGTKKLFDIEKNLRTRDMLRACCKKVDAISVTQPILQETFKNINKNTVVLPNLIDLKLFQPLDMNKSDEVRILWQGGHSHYGDVYLIKDALKKVLERNKNVKLVIFGTYFSGIFKDFPLDQVEEVTWVQHSAYPYRLPALNCDIGVAPLEDNVFNHNKSCIKYLEYGAVGMPTVASNVSPYKEVIENDKNGLLASNTDEWVEQIEQLVKDKEKRKKLARNAYEDISENHCADKYAYKWVDAYTKIIAN